MARALDRAAARWPNESRSRLLLRLVDAGDSALADESARVTQARRTAVSVSKGAYPDAFGEGYLDELRADWPE